jgi:hypothetical protein
VKKAPDAAGVFMTLGILRAAMLAKPSVSEVEEVVGFVQ